MDSTALATEGSTERSMVEARDDISVGAGGGAGMSSLFAQ